MLAYALVEAQGVAVPDGLGIPTGFAVIAAAIAFVWWGRLIRKRWLWIPGLIFAFPTFIYLSVWLYRRGAPL